MIRDDLKLCEHPTVELRRKTNVSGQSMLAQQCLRCGGVIGKWLPKREVPNPDSLPAWDERLNEAYFAGLRDANSGRRELIRSVEIVEWAKKRAWYWRDYLRSAAWQDKRQKVLERDEFECQGCGSNQNLDVHHTTYANVGNELLHQLLTLCRTCHEREHRPDTSWGDYERMKKEWLRLNPTVPASDFEAAMAKFCRELGL